MGRVKDVYDLVEACSGRERDHYYGRKVLSYINATLYENRQDFGTVILTNMDSLDRP